MGAPRKYSEEFRREAVRLVESGKPLQQVAHELGITPFSLRAWRRELAVAKGKDRSSGAGTVARLEEENRRLRRENERLREEREILKKATAFFAKDAR